MAESFVCPALRGQRVAAYRQGVPPDLQQVIEDQVEHRSGRVVPDRRDLAADILELTSDHSAERWGRQMGLSVDDVSAVLAARYVAHVWEHAPNLLAAYVWGLTDPVSYVLLAAAKTMRLDYEHELKGTLSHRADRDERMSALGPLAMFFLASVARGRAAWDVLTASDRAGPAAFGWAPSTGGLRMTLRQLLLGQGGRRVLPNALMYSPLAQYLIDLGAAQRVDVLIRQCPCGATVRGDLCARCGQVGNEIVVRRIFSKRFIAHCDRRHIGSKAVVAPTRHPRHVYLDHNPHVDLPARPAHADEPIDWQAARQVALQAGRDLLTALVHTPLQSLKSIAVCAAVARVDDVCRWFANPLGIGDSALARLVDGLLADRTPGRADCVRAANHHIRRLACQLKAPSCQPTNSGQFGVQLCRIRRRFVGCARRIIRDGHGDVAWTAAESAHVSNDSTQPRSLSAPDLR